MVENAFESKVLNKTWSIGFGQMENFHWGCKVVSGWCEAKRSGQVKQISYLDVSYKVVFSNVLK